MEPHLTLGLECWQHCITSAWDLQFSFTEMSLFKVAFRFMRKEMRRKMGLFMTLLDILYRFACGTDW